jgi:hypothetical protein
LTAYEADKEALTAQFDAAEALLKEMQASTADMHSQLETQRVKVDAVVDNLNRAVEDMRSGEQEVRDEMREIRSEVNNMQQMLPKVNCLSNPLGLLIYRFDPLLTSSVDVGQSQGCPSSVLCRTPAGTQVSEDTLANISRRFKWCRWFAYPGIFSSTPYSGCRTTTKTDNSCMATRCPILFV